jgi:predicted secreted hydrolase
MRVTGTAWFDHQWGDFVSVGGGGWDWFAINLGQQGDFALSVVRDADGKPVLVYGTAIEPGGATRHLCAGDFTIETLGSWTSPHTGRTWSSGWRVSIGVLTIELRPTVADQELDTRPTTGVAYWEGSQVVTASLGGEPLEGGEAYVELTRYTN